jgi:two-component system NarL family sensor kinase
MEQSSRPGTSGLQGEELMRPSRASRHGWSLLGAAVALAALGALLGVLNHFKPAGDVALWFDLVISLALAVPGAILVGYRPANPIGWILAAMGLASGVSVVLGEYGYYALHTNPGAVPGGVLVLWLQTLVWFPPIGLVLLLVLLVPDGSLPSPRWRPLAWGRRRRNGSGHRGRCREPRPDRW